MNDNLISVEFEAKYDSAQDLIVGYANKAVIDRGNDIIPADAWFEALSTFFKTGMPIRLLHRPKLVVGETVWLEVNSEGLKLASRPTIPEIRGLIAKGLLRGYSVGFYPVEEKRRPDGVREITKLRLVEVSYVDEPMNPESYFGGKFMPLRSTIRVHFDAASGTLTACGLMPEEMALLAQMLGTSLTQSGVADLAAVKTLAFKMAEPEETSDRATDNEGAIMKILRKIAEKLGIIACDDTEVAKSPEAVVADNVKAESTKVQSVLCSKKRFSSAEEAAAWCRKHDFHAGKVDETEEYYRFRQMEPGLCQDDSFRTITLDEGVKAVICRPKANEKVVDDMNTNETKSGTTCCVSSASPDTTSTAADSGTEVRAETPAPELTVKALEERLAGLEKDIQTAPSAVKALEERIAAQEKILVRLIEVVSQLSPKATTLATNGPDLSQKKTSWGLGWDPK